MDALLDQIADFASGLTFSDIPDYALHAARERLIDTLACAIGAQGSSAGCETALVGRSVAGPPARPDLGGRVIGSTEVLAAGDAAFINGCLIRDLDFNDTYPGHHPSDCLGAVLAIAPVVHASGEDLLTAMVISYETSIRLLKAGRLNRKGWDNGYSTGIGAAAGVARLLGLDRDRLSQAVALTAVSNVPMRATRAGQLSMWKGAATAASMRTVAFCVHLAAGGMTGPEAPFTGRHGLTDLITGPLELDPFGGDYYIPNAKLKYWPLVYNMQALVWAGIDLRAQLAGREIDKLEILTYWSAWRESGSEPAKWDPRTRQTADHSAPYILAYVLMHGEIGPAAFEPSAYLDESYRRLMARTTVAVDDRIEAEYPDKIQLRLNAVDVTGRAYQIDVCNPLGHEQNPLAPADVDAKFRRLCEPLLGGAAVDTALDAWWHIEELSTSSALDFVTIPAAAARAAGQTMAVGR